MDPNPGGGGETGSLHLNVRRACPVTSKEDKQNYIVHLYSYID